MKIVPRVFHAVKRARLALKDQSARFLQTFESVVVKEHAHLASSLSGLSRLRRSGDPLAMAYELAYEARGERCASVCDQTTGAGTPGGSAAEYGLASADALDWLARAERHFRVERVAIDRARPLASELDAIKDAL